MRASAIEGAYTARTKSLLQPLANAWRETKEENKKDEDKEEMMKKGEKKKKNP